MELSLKWLPTTPLHGLSRVCNLPPQLRPWARKLQFRGTGSVAVPRSLPRSGPAVEEGSLVQETLHLTHGALVSWLPADSASDPFHGWKCENSQLDSKNTAGWIKVGGLVLLAIGFAVGARTIYIRQAAAKGFGTVVEQTVPSFQTSESKEVEDGAGVDMGLAKDEHGRELQTNRARPDSKHQEQSTLAASPKTLGRVLVPASVDQTQEHFLAALQALKVIEASVKPGDICTRRDYARWLVVASATLSRSPAHRVFPAMYIENASRLAYDDVLPDDPDFPFIQGLAEAGLIPSTLLGDDGWDMERNMGSLSGTSFSPDSPLTRQDLITWKMALEMNPSVFQSSPKSEALQERSGFMDLDKTKREAWPALLADINAGEQSIIALAFGYTRRFQPEKPVTNAQAAIALGTGQAWEVVSEELARLEVDSIAEAAVAAELALETQARQQVATAFNDLLQMEKGKQQAAVNLVEKIHGKLEQLKAERAEEKDMLQKEWAALDSEKKLLAKLRHEVEEQALSFSGAKLEVAYERRELERLHAQVVEETTTISKIRADLEMEKRALMLARTWAQEEARKALVHSRVLEQARKRWENQGIEVRVAKDLDDTNIPFPTWYFSDDSLRSQQSLIDGVVTKSKDYARKLWDALIGFSDFVLFLCQAIKQKCMKLSQEFAQTLQDALIEFFHFVLLICQEIKQQVMKLIGVLAQKFHDARIKCSDSATQTMAGINQTLSSSVMGTASSIKESTLKAVAELRAGAEGLAHKLKIS